MSWHFEHVDGPYGNVTEGPAWDGEAVLFTSIQQSRIMRYDPATGRVYGLPRGHELRERPDVRS